MEKETIFTDIINRRIFADIIYQDDIVTAFRDKKPIAPVHILIVTNKFIASVNDINHNDEAILGRMFTVAKKMAKKEGIDKNGYRLIVNCNHHGGQEIYHLHMHLLGGKLLGTMIK